jgi:hypothetical protein
MRITIGVIITESAVFSSYPFLTDLLLFAFGNPELFEPVFKMGAFFA